MGVGGISLFELRFLSLILLGLFLIPLLLVIRSNRVQGRAKLGWSLIVLFTSFLGYGAFLVATQQKTVNALEN